MGIGKDARLSVALGDDVLSEPFNIVLVIAIATAITMVITQSAQLLRMSEQG
jgi:hypothetical protein